MRDLEQRSDMVENVLRECLGTASLGRAQGPDDSGDSEEALAVEEEEVRVS